MRSRLPKLLGAALMVSLGALAALAPAQQGSSLKTPLQIKYVARPAGMKWSKDHARAFFNTNIGSFKIMANDETPTEGTLDMVFHGTVLLSNLEPGSTLVLTGNVRKEIDDKEFKRQVFFGDGRITICGKFRSVQFFGKGLRAAFDGFGYARLYGEFDRNLETGFYWLEGTDPVAWSTGGSPLYIPAVGSVKPKVRIEGRGG
ncbi:MAG: hypothetical protein ACAH95_12145 [Fimbriimonas sp.]